MPHDHGMSPAIGSLGDIAQLEAPSTNPGALPERMALEWLDIQWQRVLLRSVLSVFALQRCLCLCLRTDDVFRLSSP